MVYIMIFPVDSDGTRIMIICCYAGDAGPHGHWHSAMLLCLELGPPLDLIRRRSARELGGDSLADAKLEHAWTWVFLYVSARKN